MTFPRLPKPTQVVGPEAKSVYLFPKPVVFQFPHGAKHAMHRVAFGYYFTILKLNWTTLELLHDPSGQA